MRSRRVTCLASLTLLWACALSAPSAQSPAAQAPTPTTGRAADSIAPTLARSVFDSAWGSIRRTYYDSTMRGVDWQRVHDELAPRAESAGTVGALRAVIAEMMGRLGESHFVVIPGEAADALDPVRPDSGERNPSAAGAPGDVGLELRLVDGRLLVTRVDPASPAARAGIAPGWALDSVGRFTAARMSATLAGLTDDAARRQAAFRLPLGAAALLAGPAGTPVTATFRDARGARRTVTLVRRPAGGVSVRFGNLPTFYTRLGWERRALAGSTIGANGACVGIIRFNIWMTPVMPEFDRAMRALGDCRGIVIDLRGNPGGVGAMVMGIGGYFLDSTISLGTMRTRTGELHFVANPHRVNGDGTPSRPYAGALAIVVDPLSMSTSEIFAAGMQAVGRARVFGDTTGRQALPATMTRLPNGDVLMHVIADFVDPHGRRIEGRGAVPDVEVPLTRASLLAGRDAPMDAALAWIGQER